MCKIKTLLVKSQVADSIYIHSNEIKYIHTNDATYIEKVVVK